MSLQKYKKRWSNFVDLTFNCVTDDRYIYVKHQTTGDHFKMETPFLKVLKPVHNHKNKSYLVLAVNTDFDFNEEVNEFVYMINKIHEFSQENIKVYSKNWFGKEFDIYDLDNIVKRPIEEHKNNNYIKLVIPTTELMESKLVGLEKDMYIKCDIEFSGLKISRETLMEEWYVTNFITQEDYENQSKVENEYSNMIIEHEISEVPSVSVSIAVGDYVPPGNEEINDMKYDNNEYDYNEEDINDAINEISRIISSNKYNHAKNNIIDNNLNTNSSNNLNTNSINDLNTNFINEENNEITNNNLNNQCEELNESKCEVTECTEMSNNNSEVDVVKKKSEKKTKHKKNTKTNLITRRKIFSIEK